MPDVTQILSRIESGDPSAAEVVRRALEAPDSELRAFLVSNDLWGGAGSIADQACACQGRGARRQFESVLVRLGVEQIRQGLTNARTQLWVDAFSQWQRDGI